MSGLDFLTTNKDKTDTQQRTYGTSGTKSTRGGTQSSTGGIQEQLNNVIASVKNLGTAEQRQALQAFVMNSARHLGETFSKERAIQDSKAGVSAVVNEILGSGLPDIRTNNTMAGGYNSTGRQLLVDNLTAQAAVQGGAVIQQTIKDYADIQLQGSNVIAGLTKLLMESEESQSGTESGSRLGQETSFSETAEQAESAEKFDESGTGRTTQRNRDSGIDFIGKVASIAAGTPQTGGGGGPKVERTLANDGAKMLRYLGLGG